MENLDSLLMELIKIGTAEIDLKIAPTVLKNESNTQVKFVPNSTIEMKIPNIDRQSSISLSVSSYTLHDFKLFIKNSLDFPRIQATKPDRNGIQLEITPIDIKENDKFITGYRLTLLPKIDNNTIVTAIELRRLYNYLNELNIHLNEAVMLNQFTMLRHNSLSDDIFNEPTPE